LPPGGIEGDIPNEKSEECWGGGEPQKSLVGTQWRTGQKEQVCDEDKVRLLSAETFQLWKKNKYNRVTGSWPLLGEMGICQKLGTTPYAQKKRSIPAASDGC